MNAMFLHLLLLNTPEQYQFLLFPQTVPAKGWELFSLLCADQFSLSNQDNRNQIISISTRRAYTSSYDQNTTLIMCWKCWELLRPLHTDQVTSLLQQSRPGNVTVSRARLVPDWSDDGRSVSCTATNPAVPRLVASASRTLAVRCKWFGPV